MINSPDVRKFIETDKYQSYIKELSENYQVKMTKNDWVAQEIAQKGKAVLYDGKVLTAETDRQAVIDSICLSVISLWVDFDDKTVSDFRSIYPPNSPTISVDTHSSSKWTKTKKCPSAA